MSDFLSNLIARSFADNPAIRPRLASRFEPSTAESFSEANADEPARTADQTAPSVQPASTSPKMIAPEPQETVKPAADAAINSTGENQAWHPNESKASVEAMETPAPRSDGRSKIGFNEKKKVVPTTVAIDEKCHGHAAKTETFEEPVKQPAFCSLRENSALRVEPRPAPPVIQVTIGRVEVRAVQSAVPAPKPSKPAPPKLSLDDYLQRREGSPR